MSEKCRQGSTICVHSPFGQRWIYVCNKHKYFMKIKKYLLYFVWLHAYSDHGDML